MRILFVYSTLNSVSTKKCCFELSKTLKRYSLTEVIEYKDINNNAYNNTKEKCDINIISKNIYNKII